MMAESRLMTELLSQAQNTRDRVKWSSILCRIAIYLSRQGHHNEALRQIKTIRDHYGVELHHEVASWVMLAEGVIHFSCGEMKQAFERIRRGHALAVALKTTSVRASCAAWMALLAFNAGRYNDMIAHLAEVFSEAAPDDHQAWSRASLVLADATQVAGSFDLAKPWYEKARRHAVAEGDQATLSAYLYNVAVFRTANLRMAAAFAEVDPIDLKRASLEAHSSFGYDIVVQSLAFGDLWKILHAQLLIMQLEYSEAKLLLDATVETNLSAKERPIVLTDLAWCNLQLGHLDIAAEQARRAESLLNNTDDSDDLALLHWRLGEIAQAFGRLDVQEEHMRVAEAFAEEHRKFQLELMGQLAPLLKAQRQ